MNNKVVCLQINPQLDNQIYCVEEDTFLQYLSSIKIKLTAFDWITIGYTLSHTLAGEL